MKLLMRFQVLLLFFLPPALCSREISVSARLDRSELELNEQAAIEVTVSGEAKGTQPPSVPQTQDFRIYQAGTSQNISIVNGNVSSAFTYRYVLTPQKAGDFIIPPFEVRYGGRIYSTEPLSIRVVAESQAGRLDSYQSSAEAPEIFIHQETDKKTAFVGEQITYTFFFYRRVNLSSNPSFQSPDFNGFLKEDLPPQKNYRKNVKGQTYMVTEVKYALFPMKSGAFTIDPARLQVTLSDFSAGFDRFFSDDFFKDFFGGGQSKQFMTGPLNLTVLPLPSEGRPVNFSGGVGRFSLQAGLDKKRIKQGEPVTLEVKVRGKGDPRSITSPEIPSLFNFKVFETISSLDLNKEGYAVGGEKVFRTLLVPQVTGNMRIPSFVFSYFDPVKKSYEKLESPPLTLEVLPGSVPPAKEDKKAVSQDLEVVREDIRYIKEKKGKKEPRPLYRKKYFFWIGLIPVFAWMAYLLAALWQTRVIAPRYEDIRKKGKIKELLKQAGEELKKESFIEVCRKIEQIALILGDSLPPEGREIVERSRTCIYSPDKKGLGDMKHNLAKFAKVLRKT
ncbi:MAG TPA: BatD family protein [bacterium]|nr:BatD family protein [bacterium]